MRSGLCARACTPEGATSKMLKNRPQRPEGGSPFLGRPPHQPDHRDLKSGPEPPFLQKEGGRRGREQGCFIVGPIGPSEPGQGAVCPSRPLAGGVRARVSALRGFDENRSGGGAVNETGGANSTTVAGHRCDETCGSGAAAHGAGVRQRRSSSFANDGGGEHISDVVGHLGEEEEEDAECDASTATPTAAAWAVSTTTASTLAHSLRGGLRRSAEERGWVLRAFGSDMA